MMRIASYNIAGGHDTFSVERVSDAITSLNVSVVCLQEVLGTSEEDSQAHEIAKRIGFAYVYFKATLRRRHGRYTMYGTAIISR
jgi:endonuclease/exonuclease/phosphatase family metal-dependent hydrolase